MAIRYPWRRMRAMPALALIAVLVLTGCGGVAPTPSPPPSQTPPPTPTTLPAPSVSPTSPATATATVRVVPTDTPAMMHTPAASPVERPATLDLATTRLSEGRHFRVTRATQPAAIVVNAMHTWTIHVETAGGAPVEGATIGVDGDMPEHGHGLPTQPEVTRDLGNGDYLVEGMLFQMPGWWIVDFDIAAGGRADRVRFNLLLE